MLQKYNLFLNNIRNWNHNNDQIKENYKRTRWASTVTVTFPQFPGIYVGLAEVSDPTGIKLLVCLYLSMGVTSGSQWS